ncbi:Protein of unknown function [Gryllus bimaculatus]|nr:Protein of unknown function [Gryllus bimaculatus]
MVQLHIRRLHTAGGSGGGGAPATVSNRQRRWPARRVARRPRSTEHRGGEGQAGQDGEQAACRGSIEVEDR